MELKIILEDNGIKGTLNYQLDEEGNLPTGLEYKIQDLVDGVVDKDDNVCLSSGTVTLRQEDDMYIVTDKDEVIYDGYDFDIAEENYHRYLDKETLMANADCAYDAVAHG